MAFSSPLDLDREYADFPEFAIFLQASSNLWTFNPSKNTGRCRV